MTKILCAICHHLVRVPPPPSSLPPSSPFPPSSPLPLPPPSSQHTHSLVSGLRRTWLGGWMEGTRLSSQTQRLHVTSPRQTESVSSLETTSMCRCVCVYVCMCVCVCVCVCGWVGVYEHVGWVQWNLQLIIFLFKLSLPCNWSASCESTLMLFLNWFSFSICSVPKNDSRNVVISVFLQMAGRLQV